MSRSMFFVISLYFSVLTCTYAAMILHDGTIIEIETIEPITVNQFNINRELNTFAGGGRGQGGRTEYQTVVNGQPVTIEVIRDDQLNRYGQMRQNQNYWQQMQKRNRYPIEPNQGSVIVTKEKSPYPNIEVYDVYTNGDINNNRNPMYPNQYVNKYHHVVPYPNSNNNNHNNNNNNRYPMRQPNGNWVPYPNGNRYPNDNFYPYPNQNAQNGDLNGNKNGMHHHINQDGQENINLSELNNNKNQQNNNLSYLSNNDNKNREPSNGGVKDNNKNNVAGYIDKFPVILLNQNEIRR